MSKTLPAPIGECTAQIDQFLVKKSETYERGSILTIRENHLKGE